MSPDPAGDAAAARATDDALLAEFGLDAVAGDAAAAAERDPDPWIGALREALATAGTRRPERVGEYELSGECARGGQGSVYRARRVRVDGAPDGGGASSDGGAFDLALKRLSDRTLASPEQRLRFEREAAAAASLDHPNVVRVFGAPEWIGRHLVLVMEWIDGEPIDRFVAERLPGRPVRDVLQLFLKVCDGVRHAHRRGVLHRDLSPANVLVTRDGRPVVVDFGLARRLDDATAGDRVTREQVVLGTLAYAAPEQVLGRSARPGSAAPSAGDVRSDVHALGVLLFELLTGALPFDVPDDPIEWIRRVDVVEPRRATSLRRDLGRDLDVVLRTAIERDPERRYATVDAFAADLDRLLAGESPLARAPGAADLLRRWARRHRAAAAAAVLATVLVPAFGIASFAQARRFLRERDRALSAEQEARLQTARADRVLEFLVADVLDAANPTFGSERRTVGDALESAAARVDDAPDDGSRAVLHYVLSRSFRASGRSDEALHHARRSVALADAALGPAHPDACRHRAHLGHVLASAGRFDQAEPLLRDAFAAQRALPGERALDAFMTWQALAHLEARTGRLDQAIASCAAAEAWMVERTGAPPPAGSSLRATLAEALSAQGRYREAAAVQEETLERDRAALGDEHAIVGLDLFHLGASMLTLRRADEAAHRVEEARGVLQRTLGAEHPILATCVLHLGRARAMQGRAAEAVALADEGLRIDAAAREADDPRRSTRGSRRRRSCSRRRSRRGRRPAPIRWEARRSMRRRRSIARGHCSRRW